MAIGVMDVILLGAKDLQNTDFFGKIDPYVVIKYRNQQHTSKIVRGGGTKPKWNEKFKFSIDHSSAEDKRRNNVLSLVIMDHDTFTQDDYLGQTIIHLEGVFKAGMENGKAELGTQKYRVVAKDGSYRGEIHLAITFTRKEKSEEAVYGGWKDSQYNMF